jgi:hypothetical protein
VTLDFASRIRRKLTDAEVSWLKERTGLELRDPGYIAAVSALEGAAVELRRLEAIHNPNRRLRQCSFCGAIPNDSNPMAQGRSEALICLACAADAVAMLRETGGGDT